ncbi:MAG: hypothetical protein JWO08_3477, partial [Verrucomicrobiaceae bacterium]|nr:hypothetical protein [Verrucomicrobiaceae bacterium]
MIKPAFFARYIARWTIRSTAITTAVSLMLCSLWYERQEDLQYQDLVVETFHSRSAGQGVATTQANAVLLLHEVHHVVTEKVKEMGENRSMEGRLFWSPGDHLRHPGGACASYSTVLAKALQTAGFAVRKVGLSSGGTKAIHHVVEALADGHWMLMDASFDLTFDASNGLKASAKDVAANWAKYRKQTPPNYTAIYNYSGFYYTNWDRIYGAGLAFKLLPALKHWVDVHEISLRFVFLNVWNWMAVFWGALAVFMVL